MDYNCLFKKVYDLVKDEGELQKMEHEIPFVFSCLKPDPDNAKNIGMGWFTNCKESIFPELLEQTAIELRNKREIHPNVDLKVEDDIHTKAYLVMFEDGFECKIENAYFDPKTAQEEADNCNGFDENNNPCEGPYSVREVDIYR